MRTVTYPEIVDVTPGTAGVISVSITNTTPVIDAYRVQVFGLDPEWVTVTPDRLSLFPGQTDSVEVQLRLPDDYPASQRTVSVNVSSDDDPGAFSLNQVALDVQPRTRTSVRVDPAMVTAGRSARFGIIVSNDGNAAVTASGYAIDPEALAEFTFAPAAVTVFPGRDQVIEVTATGGRQWFGQPRARTFTFGVATDGPPAARVESLGTFVQRPRISRWLISLLGLLTAAAVFAAVLSRTFDRVVDEARVSTDVLDAALERDGAGGAVVPTNPGAISGQIVSASTGQGLSGAQAELFVADDTENPVGSAATAADGAFTFANLGKGDYKLRVSGAGIDAVWFGDTASATDADSVAVALGEVTTLDPITISGTPVDVTGTINVPEGSDPSETTVSLVVPGAAGAGAVVATTTLAPDGSFTLPEIPSPGTYQLIVEQPGTPPQVRDLVLEPGQAQPDVEVAVVAGQGVISGTVSGPDGALGGATVTASDGTTEISTVSLTEGQVGTYALRNLQAPAQYTITIERDGFAPEARTVTLTAERPTGSFDALLVPATGSISGRVLLDGSPARGLTVTLNSGETNRATGVVSQGAAAGSYTFDRLDAPGTYTLTFSGAGTIPQVRVLDLDPATGTHAVTGVDVSLSARNTVVTGMVRGPDGAPLGQAAITLTDGEETRTMLSADDPLGRFAFAGVAPGSYTLTASRTGAVPVTVLVHVSAGTPVAALDLQLGVQASAGGRVTGFDTSTRSVPVRLFLPEQFPHGRALATTATDASGNYSFEGLEAPVNYIVAVYAGPTSADPLDSAGFATTPGSRVTVPTFTISVGSASTTNATTTTTTAAPASTTTTTPADTSLP